MSDTVADEHPAPPLVELIDIVKVFPGVRANDGVTFTVVAGEIHGLLGENGAGKSTLMSVLYGLYRPESGTILVAGTPTTIGSPRDALRNGIAIVQQHFALVPTLSVAENVILGDEPGRRIRPRRLHATVGALAERYGLAVSPDAIVGQLSLGGRQQVEILKCLHREPRVIIFDEPTTVLTPGETDRLFATMRALASEGRGIVLITHKLDELMSVTDRISVLRAGKTVATVATAEVDPPTLARLMVGRDVKLRSIAAFTGLATLEDPTPSVVTSVPPTGVAAVSPSHFTENALELCGVRVEHRGIVRLHDLDLTVHQGEVVGLAGVEGNGQRELVEILCGTRLATAGQVIVNGVDLSHAGPRGLQSAGVRVVTEDRHATGCVLDMTVAENLVSDRVAKRPLSRWGWISLRRVDEQARRLIADYDVRTPGPGTVMRALSGGNQQRAILAREMSQDVRVLVAAQPTRGLDVGSIEDVTTRVLAARDAGAGVLLISSDLAEVLAVSDRVGVLDRGRLVAVLDRADATLDRIGPLMAGVHDEVPA